MSIKIKQAVKLKKDGGYHKTGFNLPDYHPVQSKATPDFYSILRHTITRKNILLSFDCQ